MRFSVGEPRFWTTVGIAGAALAAACAPAPSPAPAMPTAATGDALASLVANELAFAAASQQVGPRDAFLRYIADDGIMFLPEPTVAKPWWEAQPPASYALAWYPSHAWVSAAGDLGFTTGPSTVRDTTPGSPVRHGHFVTVWKREPAGWRFAVDLGIRNPAPEAPEPQWRAGAPDPQTATDFSAEVLHNLLLNTDRGFGERVRDAGMAVALATFADDQVRVLRPGALPGAGKAAGGALYAGEARGYSAEPVRAVVSRSGDFGYTYGGYRWADASGNARSESGHYVRIWTRSPGGPFRLLVDVVTPRPPEREE